MADSLPFLRDDFVGNTQTIEFEGEDVSIVTKWDDLATVLDDTAAKRSAGREYYARDPEMWRVAHIPIGIQYEWITKHGVDLWNRDHQPAVKRLLNSSDYRYLKTADIII
jgi:hypothetical protein